MAELRIYVANLGKYNEGELVGAWIDLPCSEEELQALFVRIGLARMVDGEYVSGVEVDGVVYEEHAIHDFDTDIDGLEVGEYDDLDALNGLAEQFIALSSQEENVVAAAIECFGYSPLEVIERINDFNLYSDIQDEYDLGYYWAVESGCYEIDEKNPLSGYIDYARFGRDICSESNGGFTAHGWIEEVR